MSHPRTLEDVDSSSEEDESVSQREVRQSEQSRYKWKSNLDFLIISTVYSTTTYNFKVLVDNKTLDTSIIQTIVSCFLVGMPIQYMQVVLGQYCDRSILNIKYMSTIGFAVGSMFIIQSVRESVPNAVFAADSLIYLLNCFQKTLPWMECKPEDNQTCWTQKCEGPGPCIKENVITATRFYWNITLTHVDSPDIVYDFKRYLILSVFWIVIFWYLSTVTGFSTNLFKWMQLFTVATRYLTITVMLFTCDGASNGIHDLFSLNVKWLTFFDLNMWIKSTTGMLVVLSIDKGGYMMFGSYMGRRQSAGNLTVAATVLAYINNLGYLVLFHISLAIVTKAAKLPPDKRTLLVHSSTEPLTFTITLNGLGYTYMPHVWSVIFLAGAMMESFAYFVLMIQPCEIALQDIYPQYHKYRKYLLLALLFICEVLCIPFILRGPFSSYLSILPFVKISFATINLFLFALLVSWMYGVQRLSDDLHFITGQQPGQFWKISWYIAPFILGTCSVIQITFLCKNTGTAGIVHLSLMLFVPFIFFIVQSIKHAKLGNQAGFFHSEELWGPPSIMERYLRAIFNPRKEIKSRRRYDVCKHKCLLQCAALAKTLEEGKERRMNQKVQRRLAF